ncbi:MAG: cytidylate kinase family protein [Nanoarchaeota archaeon]|nr:cytidylate kinase family protein [Nanoarchaeota archaeon]
MKVTISGKPGSGKSTVAKLVAEQLGYTHHSMGDLQRQIAKERGLTMLELAALEEKDPSIDKEIDEKQKYIGQTEDNFVMDGRISYHFVPDSIKIFLDIDDEVGAERIFKEKRADEKFSTLEKAKREIAQRVESEKKRYKEFYGLDHYDLKQYDKVIDTTNMTVEQVVEKIVSMVKE